MDADDFFGGNFFCRQNAIRGLYVQTWGLYFGGKIYLCKF